MANVNIPTDIAGGFKYTPVSYSFGDTSQVINGGFSFDLPLATVAAFTNTALDFNANNSAAARGFLTGVIAQGQTNLAGITDKAFALQRQALGQAGDMFSQAMAVQQYAIKKGSGGSGCFITTAVTKAKGLPDDCEELQSLRNFRDSYMLATEEGKVLVKLYYAVAPSIVEAIDSRPDAASVYARLDSLFIQPALHRIGSGELEVALGIYTALVLEAAALTGVEVKAPEVGNEKPTCTCNAGKRAPNFHAKTCPVRG